MRKLVLKMSMSLDGFVCGPQGEIDWVVGAADPARVEWTVGLIGQAGMHLMGSRTYHDMAAYWPTSAEPYAPPMNEIPKAVFTRKGLDRNPATPQTTRAIHDASKARADRGESALAAPAAGAASWDAAYEARGDLTEEITRLKRQPGRFLLAHGGAGFARSLAERGLVDEFCLLVHPVALGRGQPLFASLPKPMPLALMFSTTFRDGAMAVGYRVGA